MSPQETTDLCAWEPHCYESPVNGSKYCEDHLLQSQVRTHQIDSMGSLASLIKKARGKGLLKPVSSYAGT